LLKGGRLIGVVLSTSTITCYQSHYYVLTAADQLLKELQGLFDDDARSMISRMANRGYRVGNVLWSRQ
jgi:hypothetical protein